METTLTTPHECSEFMNSLPAHVAIYLHVHADDGGYVATAELTPRDAVRLMRNATHTREVFCKYEQDQTLFITIKSNK